jgi:hypothetical protein
MRLSETPRSPMRSSIGWSTTPLSSCEKENRCANVSPRRKPTHQRPKRVPAGVTPSHVSSPPLAQPTRRITCMTPPPQTTAAIAKGGEPHPPLASPGRSPGNPAGGRSPVFSFPGDQHTRCHHIRQRRGPMNNS